VDVSIADLVADHWAHTPTEAAQVATAHWRAAPNLIVERTVRLRRQMATLVQSNHRQPPLNNNRAARSLPPADGSD